MSKGVGAAIALDAGDAGAQTAAMHADDEAARVLALIRRHGWNATSFQVLEPGYRYWFTGDANEDAACVAYVDSGRTWVAAGAPIAAESQLAQVTAEFMQAAAKARRKVVFFGVEDRFVRATGLPAFKIGEQPTWDPARWDAGIRASRSLREQLRRARAKGVVVRSVGPPELAPGSPMRAAIDGLVRRWLASRAMAPMGFLVDIEPYRFAEERRYWAAEVDGRLVGFVAAVPIFARGRDGQIPAGASAATGGAWLVEDLLRAPEAPNGMNELLIDTAMRAFADAGATFVTLGMVPLAGVERWLARVRDATRVFYDFAGLDAFKSKLRPSARDPVLLAHAPGMRPLFALRAVLTAFARGSLWRFGVATVARGGPHALATLAALLVPWTVLLALAPARWFPSAAVQLAWVGFDVLLAGALFTLARRWRTTLGRVVALAVSCDVALTLAQAIAWNWPRRGDVWDVLVIAVACLAPALGAVVVWGALRRGDVLVGRRSRARR